MSEKPQFITQGELILNEIPQRGEPPYFIHSGRAGMTENTDNVHGITVDNWTQAIEWIANFSEYGLSAHNQQILVGFPEHTGLLYIDQLQQAEIEGRIVFDMRNQKDVELLRIIDRG